MKWCHSAAESKYGSKIKISRSAFKGDIQKTLYFSVAQRRASDQNLARRIEYASISKSEPYMPEACLGDNVFTLLNFDKIAYTSRSWNKYEDKSKTVQHLADFQSGPPPQY